MQHVASSRNRYLRSLGAPAPPPAVVNGVGTLYRNAWECASKTVAAEGPLALYKGATAHFMRAGPHTVLTLMLLTHLQRVLGLTPPQAAQQAARPGATATAAKS